MHICAKSAKASYNINNYQKVRPLCRAQPLYMKRLAPYIAQRFRLSRREAEKAIVQGRVCIDGTVYRDFVCDDLVFQEGRISVDDTLLEAPPLLQVWSYHKPPGEIVTRRDPQKRRTVFHTLEKLLPPSILEKPLVSIGRLDYLSEGLLLFTNQPSFAHMAETQRWSRTYHVWVQGVLKAKALDWLRLGACIEGVFYRPCTISLLASTRYDHCLKIILDEGKNREIRRLMKAIDLKVVRLKRISFGSFHLGTLSAEHIRSEQIS